MITWTDNLEFQGLRFTSIVKMLYGEIRYKIFSDINLIVDNAPIIDSNFPDQINQVFFGFWLIEGYVHIKIVHNVGNTLSIFCEDNPQSLHIATWAHESIIKYNIEHRSSLSNFELMADRKRKNDRSNVG